MDFDQEATTKKGLPGSDLTQDEISREMQEHLDRQMSDENTRNEEAPNEGSLARPSAHLSVQGEPPYVEMEGTLIDSVGHTQNLNT